jgi:hypothetical protein
VLTRRRIRLSTRQLQKKFKHATDFGITGNCSPANAAQFERVIISHVKDPATMIIRGVYRGRKVTHFYNPNAGLNVVRNADGAFESGWKPNPQQVQHLLRAGKLGGG